MVKQQSSIKKRLQEQKRQEEAKTAFNEGEVPIGAVIVKNEQIVSLAHNKCRSMNDPSMHAECIVLKEAYSKLKNFADCTLYVTVEPCAMCAGTILQYRLPRVVFGAYEPVTGCCGSKIDLLDQWFDTSSLSVGGILEKESKMLLNEFFSLIRCDEI